MATSTPWGKSQWSKKIAPGIMVYSTASHGGYHLSPSKNEMIPRQWRNPDGWYEEDCGWAPLVIIFPDLFPPEAQDSAKRVIPSWESWCVRNNWI